MVMEKGCENYPAFKTLYPEEKDRKNACHMIREDGKYVESGEDDNVIVAKLEANHAALGIFGYSFLMNNADKVQGSLISGVAPEPKTIEDHTYSISRSLFVYVKN